MRKPGTRYDYQPGRYAEQMLHEARAEDPEISHQALIDKLVILGRWAQKLVLQPPLVLGKNRQR